MNDYKIYFSRPVFPTPDIERTAGYYSDVLGFRVVSFLDAKEPHVCLYRDFIEIILTKSNGSVVQPNRELYGYGYDAYCITDDQESLQSEFSANGANIVKPLFEVDYHYAEFVVEDIDGRWIGFGKKGDGIPTVK